MTRSWTQLSSGPSGRAAHCLESNPANNQLILFGGSTASAMLNDLWTFSIESNQWQEITPVDTSKPSVRVFHACALNPQLGILYAQGGMTGPEYLQDLWQFDFPSRRWSMINSGNGNVLLRSHSMRYSDAMKSLYVFFGINQSTGTGVYTSRMYRLSVSTSSSTWSPIQFVGIRIPSIRALFSTGFNPQTGEYFVFGGGNGFTYLSTFDLYPA